MAALAGTAIMASFGLGHQPGHFAVGEAAGPRSGPYGSRGLDHGSGRDPDQLPKILDRINKIYKIENE